MKINQKDIGETRIFGLHGRLALGDGEQDLVRVVEEWLNQGGRKVVINLSDVPWMDSSGMGHTVKCRGLASEKQAAIALVIPRATKLPMLVQVCMRLAFDHVCEDEISAVESLGR